MRKTSGLAILAVAACALINPAAPLRAEETKLPLPTGWSLAPNAVAVLGEYVAVGLRNNKRPAESRITQFRDGEQVYTDIPGFCIRLEFAIDGEHLLATMVPPAVGTRNRSSRFYVIDAQGTVTWTSSAKANHRFSTGGETVYFVARVIGDGAKVYVFDHAGESIREVGLDRKFEDAVVVGNGEQMIFLFKNLDRAREERHPTVERIDLTQDNAVLWKVELPPNSLHPNPTFNRVDENTLLIERRSGFNAISLDGATYEYDPLQVAAQDTERDARHFGTLKPYPGPRPGTLLLHGSRDTRVLELKSGTLRKSGIPVGKSYFPWKIKGRSIILIRPNDLLIRSLTDEEES